MKVTPLTAMDYTRTGRKQWTWSVVKLFVEVVIGVRGERHVTVSLVQQLLVRPNPCANSRTTWFKPLKQQRYSHLRRISHIWCGLQAHMQTYTSFVLKGCWEFLTKTLSEVTYHKKDGYRGKCVPWHTPVLLFASKLSRKKIEALTKVGSEKSGVWPIMKVTSRQTATNTLTIPITT